MADDDITNLSEIDWDNVTMNPHHGLEGYEPRPEYSETVQERKRSKAILGLKTVQAAIRPFLVIGAVLLMKAIVDYADDIKNGVIEPPAYNELVYLVYLVLGIDLMLVILLLVKRLRQSIYGDFHPIHNCARRSIWHNYLGRG